MSQHVSIERLNDALDGLLNSAEIARLEAHVETCAPCRQEYARLSETVEAARALPKTAAPPEGAWSGIAARIAEPLAAARRPDADVVRLPTAHWAGARLSLSVQQLAVAAVLVAVVSASAVWLAMRPDAGLRSLDRVTAGSAGGPAARAVSSVRYAEVVDELEALLTEGRATLAPATLAVIEGSLETVNTAIEEVEAALGEDPNSELLLRLLATHQRTKLGVLQRAAQAVRTQT